MFPNGVIDGGDILIYVGGKVLGCATTHTIEITNATREVSCKGSGDFTSSEYGRFSWTVSVDALANYYEGDIATVLRYPELIDLFLNKTIVTVESKYEVGSDVHTLSGQAVISSISENAPDSDNTTFSVSLQGRGTLGQSGTNLWEVTINATGADYIIVEETGRIYPYTAGMKILMVDGTYNILAYETVTVTRDRDSVTVSGANTNISLTLA
jgi:predicted secreted protein